MAAGRDPLSAYLLGEMGPREAEDFERRMRRDPKLRAEVENLRPLVAQVESITAEVGDLPDLPPPEEAEPPPPAPAPGRRRRFPRPRTVILRPLAASALATLLLAVGVTVGVVVADGGDGGTTGGAKPTLSRLGAGPVGASGTVDLVEGETGVALAVEGLEPSGSDRFYELWLRDPDGRGIVLGSFPVGEDGTAEARLPLPVPPSEYRFFDVSLQRHNGDPSHSGVSVLRAPAAAPPR